jgi:iron(III) transport system ATP-binding protein
MSAEPARTVAMPDEMTRSSGEDAAPQPPMLQLAGINLSFGRNHVVRDVSFEVGRGALVCLLGPSGCGKTTTLRLIAGLEAPASGTVTIDGQRVSGNGRLVPPHRRNVGFLFQDFALFPHLTVAENVAFGLARLDRDAARRRTLEMLERVRLLEHAGKYPHMLSGGEQQRVALARALAPNPGLILLDEPFSDLDTSLRGQVRDETLRLLRDTGVTTVMVTHDPEEAMLTADRIVLMRDGQVVQTGTPNALYLHPVDAFTAGFFGDLNRLDGIVDGGWIRTCLGAIPNRQHADGSRVDVLIRPDALTLAPPGTRSNQPDTEARVCAVQYAGRCSLVRIGLGDGTDPRTHFQARHAGLFPSRVGERLRVTIDQAQTFVFEKPDGRAG